MGSRLYADRRTRALVSIKIMRLDLRPGQVVYPHFRGGSLSRLQSQKHMHARAHVLGFHVLWGFSIEIMFALY